MRFIYYVYVQYPCIYPSSCSSRNNLQKEENNVGLIATCVMDALRHPFNLTFYTYKSGGVGFFPICKGFIKEKNPTKEALMQEPPEKSDFCLH